MDQQSIVQVVVDVPLQGTFSYLTQLPLMAGQRVVVSFGSRRMCGVVVTDSPQDDIDPSKLKQLDSILVGLPPLPENFMALARFAAHYYHHPLGQTIFTALPSRLREPRAISLPDERPYTLTLQGEAEAPPARHRAKLALWQALQGGALTITEAKAVTPQASKILSEWLVETKVARLKPEPIPFVLAENPKLNEEQQAALNAFRRQPGYQTWLLHGITGSGKTEVYLQLIADQLARGRQVLVLVPEINLTPQLISRFARRFTASHIAVQHSHLSENERLKSWLDGWMERADVMIGTRLSVFTPLPRLGLIVVDEEHDSSFKQQHGLCYLARDLAIWRARQASVPIVLGSATPSLETVSNIETGRYRRLYLRQRAHGEATLPAVRLIDVRRNKLIEGLAEPVIPALRQRLARGEMSLVFINRRGFAPILACIDCGWTKGCPCCATKLVVHLFQRKLRCHYCNREEPLPRSCQNCGNPDIKPLGEGTQRVESALKKLLPNARILRIDRDTTNRKAGWEETYHKVHASEVDILVGTQMLTKGHDFGALSLVVVLGADSGLYSADFRASERLFAQLIQVAGRSGRAGTAGEVLVQTQWADHELFQALIRNDFDGYTQTLLEERRIAGFPPYAYQAVLRADSPKLELATTFLTEVRQLADPLATQVLIAGPAPALMARLANRERVQLMLESPQREALHQLLHKLLPQVKTAAKHHGRHLRWSLDVDPQEM